MFEHVYARVFAARDAEGCLRYEALAALADAMDLSGEEKADTIEKAARVEQIVARRREEEMRKRLEMERPR